MTARANGLKRRLRRTAIDTIRRRGLLPSTMADRNGDDERLAGTRLEQSVLVYFPDTRENLYQLRQWYAPLRALDARHRVLVVLQDSRTAKVVREESGLPAITIARYGALDDLLARSDVKLALYVNHSPQNFAALRFTSLVHVFLNHGESDKGVSVSNQAKAYDYCFVAGQAAVDRMAQYTMFFDAPQRCVTIGRPQLDSAPTVTDRPSHETGGRATVLYAPTWEGAQPSLSYGSLVSHGPRLVRALLASGRLTVAYRPHPLSGMVSPAYGDADAVVRGLIETAAAADPAAGHRVEIGPTLEESFAGADLLVGDVSAVVSDWLPTGRPVVITVPESPDVVTAGTRLLDTVPRLSVADLGRAADLVAEQVDRDPQQAERAALVDYYLGDTSPGASTVRFVDACTDAIARRDAEWARVTALGPAGP